MQTRSRTLSRNRLFAALAVATLGALSVPAQAAGDSYLGLGVGRSESKADCGTGLYDCDRRDNAVKLSYGHDLLPFLGLEAQLLRGGKFQRGGGDTRIDTADAFVVGKLPLGIVTPFAKLGTSYARTRTGSELLSGIPGGDAKGWGPSGGVGVSVDLGPQWAAVAEWERRRVELAGEGRSNLDLTSVGLRYRF